MIHRRFERSPFLGRSRTLLLAPVGLFLMAAGLGPQPQSDEPAEAGGVQADRQQVALVTGSTSGLGAEVARRLGAMGCHVIVHGRDEARGMEVVRQIESEGSGSAVFRAADLASLEEVRGLAEWVLERFDHLDLLVNNAGIGTPRDGRRESEDGYELVFQVNYLSHFLLTELLLPRIRASAPARIVNVASAAQTDIDFDDVMLEEEGALRRAYGQSKLAQVFHTFDLARKLEGSGVLVNALHPATYMDTGMVRRAGITPRSTVDEGADAVMQLITGDVGSGTYYNRMEATRAHPQAYDEEARARLRRLSLQLVGLEPR